jgi:hypothetical protein
MKMIVLLSILILMTGCAVQDCRFHPQVSIETKSDKTQSESTPESKKENNPVSIIKDIQDRAQPGGQYTCKY